MKMGAREYLFLWSLSLEHKYPWEEVLENAKYDAHRDTIFSQFNKPGVVGHTTLTFQVHREGSDSCDILKKHGLTQDEIDKAVKEYLEP